MINIAFRVLLTVNATSLLVIIFLVQKGYTLGFFFNRFFSDVACLDWTIALPNAVSYLFFVMSKNYGLIKNQKFEISNDDESKQLYGIEQRFYTTPFGHEKRLANSVTAMG